MNAPMTNSRAAEVKREIIVRISQEESNNYQFTCAKQQS